MRKHNKVIAETLERGRISEPEERMSYSPSKVRALAESVSTSTQKH